MARITRLEIKSFRGIRDLSIAIPPSGAIIKGGNARGKSSVLKAIGAALAAQGVEPDAIRKGDEGAEILIDMDAIRVRRAITAKGSSLTVTNADGDKWSKPQTRLTELLGTCPLDALSFFLADPKERRRQVLEALPVAITTDDVARWAPGATKILDRVSIDGHGLEALERLRKAFYDIRADINRAAKEARSLADAAASFPPAPEGAMSLDEATAQGTAAARHLVELEVRARAAGDARQASEKTRARIAELKARAEAIRAGAMPNPTDEQLSAAQEKLNAARTKVEAARAALQEAEDAEAEAEERLDNLSADRGEADRAARDAAALDSQAGELQETLAAGDAMAVPDEEIASARAARDRAAAVLDNARAAQAAADAEAAANEKAAEAATIEAKAAELDAIVRTLSTTAPAEIAARSNLIPGLSFEGDSLTLDGVAIDSLSGAEQMRFAVDLCRRLNAKARILVVDGLERLDEDAMEAFVTHATADGWQLIATRVSKGELVVEAIAPGTKL